MGCMGDADKVCMSVEGGVLESVAGMVEARMRYRSYLMGVTASRCATAEGRAVQPAAC